MTASPPTTCYSGESLSAHYPRRTFAGATTIRFDLPDTTCHPHGLKHVSPARRRAYAEWPPSVGQGGQIGARSVPRARNPVYHSIATGRRRSLRVPPTKWRLIEVFALSFVSSYLTAREGRSFKRISRRVLTSVRRG
jgi:hypothetical protein